MITNGKLMLLLAVSGSLQVESLNVRPGASQFVLDANGNLPYCKSLTNHLTHFSIEVGVGTPPQKKQVLADTGSSGVMVKSCTGHGNTSCFASKSVQIGNMNAEMVDGLSLMSESQKLPTGLDGILGLGLPSHNGKSLSFAEAAGADSYSICFGGSKSIFLQPPGVLNFDPPAAETMLLNAGISNWGLALHGVNVGHGVSDDHHSVACDGKQGEACTVIPDSASTLIMAPQAHLDRLYADLCLHWARCKGKAYATHEADVNDVFTDDLDCSSSGLAAAECKRKQAKLASIFTKTLGDCGSWEGRNIPWIGEQGVLNEMPDLFLKLAGGDGQTKTLSIKPWAYVSTQGAKGTQKNCFPMFKSTNTNNGVWVLGQPLFYQYQVVFGLNPPSIGFSEEICKTCEDQVARFHAPDPHSDDYYHFMAVENQKYPLHRNDWVVRRLPSSVNVVDTNVNLAQPSRTLI
jgi:hypothetical protein